MAPYLTLVFTGKSLSLMVRPAPTWFCPVHSGDKVPRAPHACGYAVHISARAPSSSRTRTQAGLLRAREHRQAPQTLGRRTPFGGGGPGPGPCPSHRNGRMERPDGRGSATPRNTVYSPTAWKTGHSRLARRASGPHGHRRPGFSDAVI